MSKSKGQHDEDGNNVREDLVIENGDQCNYAQMHSLIVSEISAPVCFLQLSVLKPGTAVIDFTQKKSNHLAATAVGHKSIEVCRV